MERRNFLWREFGEDGGMHAAERMVRGVFSSLIAIFARRASITVFVELNFSTEDPVNGGGISQNERHAYVITTRLSRVDEPLTSVRECSGLGME